MNFRYAGKGWDVTYVVCADASKLGISADEFVKATSFQEGNASRTSWLAMLMGCAGGEHSNLREKVRLFSNNECYRLMGFRRDEEMKVWRMHYTTSPGRSHHDSNLCRVWLD